MEKITTLMMMGDLSLGIYPEGRSRPAIISFPWPSSVHLASPGTIIFFLILLWTFLCRCFAYGGVSCQNLLKQSMHSLHTRDRTLEVGPLLPPGAACILPQPTQAWVRLDPIFSGNCSSSWLVSKALLCIDRSSMIKKFSAHPENKTMLFCSPSPLQSHVSFALLTTSAH